MINNNNVNVLISEPTTDLVGLAWESRGFLAYVDHWASQNGEQTAIHFGGTLLSYAELTLQAKVLASGLAALGVEAGAKVGIGVSRSELLVPLLLAVWSLRAAYVPVDPSYPVGRQNYILENAEADVLVADGPRSDLTFPGTTVTVDQLKALAAGGLCDTLSREDYLPSDMAYMIYTSGSTGNPKGVAVNQGNLINFLLSMAQEPGLDQTDRLLAITTISFDIHILELFLPLLVGAKMILASKQEAVTPDILQCLVDDHEITVLQATPATWRMVLGRGWIPKKPLKILVGGEALPTDLRPLMHAASTELWNMYGPTETTVWSTCHLIRKDDQKVFIGSAIRNTTIHVVDEQLNPVADGSTGELLIGGAGVTDGYYRNPTLTDEKFIVNPVLEDGRVYRTGDAVIRHPSGVLEYVNRIDNQIKIRGFRIEPSEIEFVLARHPQIKQAAVVAADFEAGDKRMLAFYLGEQISSSDLQSFCAQHLPAHMVPHHFVWLAEYPMTANYKVDRKALVAMSKDKVNEQVKSVTNDARDDLDRSIIAVWEKSLGISGISIDDNFFELGGHSLLALQVIGDTHRATGLTFSSIAFFEAPTIRALRSSLGDEVNRAASVVKLNAVETGEPVFCLCGVQIYRELALQYERPVYGVFAEKEFAFIESNEHVSYSFDQLVSTYLSAIKRQGQYESVTLVGLSFGGLIAMEVAKRLIAEGVKVSNVILLDTYIESSSYRSISKTISDTAVRIRRDGFMSLVYIGRRIARKVLRTLGKKTVSNQFDLNKIRKGREQAFDRAAAEFEHTQRNYGFDVLLVKATLTNFGFGFKAKKDYNLKAMIKGELKIREVEADHVDMMAGTAAVEVFEVIKRYEQQRTRN